MTVHHIGRLAGMIVTPLRASQAGAVLVLGVVTAISVAMLAPHSAGPWALAALVLAWPLALWSRDIHVVHVTLLALVWLATAAMLPASGTWPLHMLAPLLIYGAVVLTVPALRRTLGWLRAGQWNASVAMLVAATVLVSGLGLVLWVAWWQPDLGGMIAMMPDLPVWTYLLAALGFAALNAAMEEAVFRGILLEALDSALGEGWTPVIIQAGCFAALHFISGFPNGPVGLVMTFVYGIMLGVVRRQSRGILAPWLAHVAADLTVFALLWAAMPGPV